MIYHSLGNIVTIMLTFIVLIHKSFSHITTITASITLQHCSYVTSSLSLHPHLQTLSLFVYKFSSLRLRAGHYLIMQFHLLHLSLFHKGLAWIFFSLWLISLNTILSSSIHVEANGKITLFYLFCAEIRVYHQIPMPIDKQWWSDHAVRSNQKLEKQKIT